MWFYNDKLGRWYHPAGAVSDNGPNDPPAEIPVDAPSTLRIKPVDAPSTPPACIPCGYKTRQVR